MRRALAAMLLTWGLHGLAAAEPPAVFAPPEATNAPSKFRSPDDGWLDLSGFLEERYGFLPVIMPITEPAVGYGAAGALAFLREPKGETRDRFARPNITAVGGMGTENGWRGQVAASFGDAPFYLRPFVYLRGVPIMRFQGEQIAQIETELRWQFWKRFSLVGFVGGGAAWNDFERFDNSQTVVAGGAGFRYEIARRHGIHLGLDVALGPDDPAIYVQVGSAWARP